MHIFLNNLSEISFSHRSHIQIFFGHTVFLNLVCRLFYNTWSPSSWGLRVQKYLIFDASGEVHLCLLKRFLFLKYLQTIVFSFYIKYALEKCQKYLIWVYFFGHLYHSKIRLDAALPKSQLGCFLACCFYAGCKVSRYTIVKQRTEGQSSENFAFQH